MSRSKQIVLLTFAALFVLAAGAGLVVRSLQNKISTRLERGWVIPPLELYSQGFTLAPGRKFPLEALQTELSKQGLVAGRDYQFDVAEACAEVTGVNIGETAEQCLWLKSPSLVVTWDSSGGIVDLYRGEPLAPVHSFGLFPKLITQFFENQPLLQRTTPLSDFPLVCLQAVTAIEDRDFLEHKGVSATGILRAMYRNLKARRWAEGGSTITQQLVKNFFLESKKTLRRKVEEQILAVLLEAQLDKDQILEMYLNVIYMGQSGPYQVRGLGSAAEVVFDKPVSRLSLHECALLAAMINSPGRYSPVDHPEAARSRRDLVIRKMQETGMINEREATEAAAHVPQKSAPTQRRAHAPYFVLAALKEFNRLAVDAENGARIYTTLDPDAQGHLTSAVAQVMPAVEKRVKNPSPRPLQVAALAVDVTSGEVLALTGGRDYRSTQFNRAIDSQRQIGSVVKPFVYLTALKEIGPLSPISDESFEWKSGRQTWRPKNYESKSYNGDVPMFFALAQSMNIPTARIGQQVGLDAISDTLEAAGVTSPIPTLPSLTLGALELSPFEVAQAYTTLAGFGERKITHLVARVESVHGDLLYEFTPPDELALDRAESAVVVGMLRQTLNMGTAKAARAMGLDGDFAGKTGTTSDSKDAWFAGFNRRLLVVVWVGYDDNTVMGLTGASAALPVWVNVMKGLQGLYQTEAFLWPEGVEIKEIPREDLLREFPVLPVKDLPESVELVLPAWAS